MMSIFLKSGQIALASWIILPGSGAKPMEIRLNPSICNCFNLAHKSRTQMV